MPEVEIDVPASAESDLSAKVPDTEAARLFNLGRRDARG